MPWPDGAVALVGCPLPFLADSSLSLLVGVRPFNGFFINHLYAVGGEQHDNVADLDAPAFVYLLLEYAIPDHAESVGVNIANLDPIAGLHTCHPLPLAFSITRSSCTRAEVSAVSAS